MIAMHHIQLDFPQGVNAQGWIGVDFFFILSGFLMARHMYSHPLTGAADGAAIATETWRFILGKIKSFYKYLLMGAFVQLIVRFILIKHIAAPKILRQFLTSLPNFSLIFMGLVGNSSVGHYVGNTWYLSSMIIAMFILYPMLLKGKSFSTRILFPLLSVFGLALIYNNISFSAWKEWQGWTYWGNIRSVAELALGASLYELTDWLHRRDAQTQRSKWMKLLCTAVKYASLLVIVAFGAGIISKSDAVHVVLYCALFILLSFSGLSYTIPGNRFTSYCGKISLPIFIFHGIIRHSFNEAIPNHEIGLPGFFALVGLAVVLSVALMYLTDAVAALLKKRRRTGEAN